MIRNTRLIIGGGTLLSMIALAASSGETGGDKKKGKDEESPWKVIVPPDIAKEICKRSLAHVGELAGVAEPGLLEFMRGEALIVAATSRTTKDAGLKGLGSISAQFAIQARNPLAKGDIVRKMAMFLAKQELNVTSGAEEPKEWPSIIGDIKPLMTLFETKAKKGEGIHPDLQYNAKVKSANGIEALIYALADKKLNDANANKVAKELELLAYRVAVIGEVCRVRGSEPILKSDKKDDKKRDGKIWNEQSIAMRDASVELAVAANKKDSAGILEACKKLENSCVECHAEFK